MEVDVGLGRKVGIHDVELQLCEILIIPDSPVGLPFIIKVNNIIVQQVHNQVNNALKKNESNYSQSQ